MQCRAAEQQLATSTEVFRETTLLAHPFSNPLCQPLCHLQETAYSCEALVTKPQQTATNLQERCFFSFLSLLELPYVVQDASCHAACFHTPAACWRLVCCMHNVSVHRCPGTGMLLTMSDAALTAFKHTESCDGTWPAGHQGWGFC